MSVWLIISGIIMLSLILGTIMHIVYNRDVLKHNLLEYVNTLKCLIKEGIKLWTR